MKTKFILSLVLFMCCAANLVAQSSNWQWARTSISPGPYDPFGALSEVYGTSTDAAGNVFVTGEFGGPSITIGSTTLYNYDASGNTYDVFIAKYDPNGNALWAKNAGGTAYDNSYSVCTDAFGNVYMTGSFQGQVAFFGSVTIVNGNNDMFLAKYDTNGNLIWVQHASAVNVMTNNVSVTAMGVGVDPMGNAYVTGNFIGQTATFGAFTITAGNTTIGNMFFVKYDPNGNVIWAKAAGGTCQSDGLSVSGDPFGNIYVSGFFYNSNITFGSILLPNFGLTDAFIVKYDTNGNELWAKTIGGPRQDFGYCVRTDSVGNIFVSGDFQSPSMYCGTNLLTNADPSGNTRDVFFAKCDSAGNVLWAKSAGGVYDEDGGCFISPGLNGDFYLVGAFQSPSIVFNSMVLNNAFPDQSYNMFIVKFDANVNPLCGSVVPGTIPNQKGLATDPSGNALVGANLPYGPIILGQDTLTPTWASDLLVAKYNCCTLSSLTITSDTTIGPGQSVTLNASGGADYFWNTGENGSSITVSPAVPTIYCVNAVDGTGNCSSEACVQINVGNECGTDLFIANAFSPNGDGANDFVQVHFRNYFCVNTFYIAIYDRWGEKVFESNDPYFKWDGTFRGQKMFTQVLEYYIQTTTIDGKENLLKGNISLIL